MELQRRERYRGKDYDYQELQQFILDANTKYADKVIAEKRRTE